MDDFYSKLGKRRAKFFELIETRHPCEVLRVRYWYQGLMQRVGSRTAYEIEHEIEPRSFARWNGRIAYRGKWKGYEYGMSRPREKLQMEVDSRFPGSRYELNHPIWFILRQIDSANLDIEIWFGMLEPGLRLILYKRGSVANGGAWIRKGFSKEMGVRLLRQGSLDGLAALLLYWYEANKCDNYELKEKIADIIFYALLIFCSIFYFREIAYELFFLFKKVVFDRVKWRLGVFWVKEELFEYYVDFLAGYLAGNDNMVKNDSVDDKVNLLYEVLYNFRMGFDIALALRMRFLPGWSEGPPTRSQLDACLTQEIQWEWGWRHLKRDTKGMVLDDEFFQMLDSARIEWKL